MRIVKSGITVAFSCIALWMVGCDSQRVAELEEGLATETDVRARFGEPENVWLAEDLANLGLPSAVTAPGARTFEYNRQPAGAVNYMITLSADGRMSSLRQVLTPANFARVQPGMNVERVRKLLGKPMRVTPFPLKNEVHYDWRYRESPTQTLVFTAVFDTELKLLRSQPVPDTVTGDNSAGR